MQTVSRTAGHLGSNLGAVELTIALHRVFESPRDVILWDTGHQAYVHKLVTGRRDDFDTPALVECWRTAPYMHDGSQKTLEEVVEWYAKGGHQNEWLSEKVKKFEASDQDKQDLVAFMKALSGPFPNVETGRLPE